MALDPLGPVNEPHTLVRGVLAPAMLLEYPRLSDRRNIVVIADEAHRTQYGFEARLKTRKPPTALRTGHRAPGTPAPC